MKTALVTGANRGIGFEIVRQLLRLNYKVFLTARNIKKGKTALKALKKTFNKVYFFELDIADEKNVQLASQKFKSFSTELNLLVNNAAILLDENKINETSKDILLKTINTNTIGPFLVINNFLPYMPNNSRIINVSGGLGSLNEMTDRAAAYSISKTALSAVTKQFALNLLNRNISVNTVCPGWVRTDMGGKKAPRSVKKGAETIIWLATEAPQDLTGKFLRDSKVIDW